MSRRADRARRTRAAVLLVAGVALAAATACSGGKPEATLTTIQVKGSDTMVNVTQAWAEEYRTVDPTANVEVSGGGSGVGIASLTKGAIDIATASRTIHTDEQETARKNTGKEAVDFTVGFDALAVYAHVDNPLVEISFPQLADIYAEGGTVTRWSQLGVTIPGVTDDTIVRVSRQSSSGTYEFFREHVLGKKDFRLGSRDMNGSKEVVELVAHTKTAIGYSGMGYAMPTVKMLKVAVRTGEPGSAPTVENTVSKSYPLARSLHVYTLGQPTGAVKKFIDWMLSDAGQKILRDNGYVPATRQ